MTTKDLVVEFKNVGILTDCYPFSEKIGDIYNGISVDLMKDIFNILLEYDYKITEFSSNYEKLLNDLSNGKIDIIIGCCPTSYILSQKYPKILFSRPYYISMIRGYSRKKLTTNKYFRLFVIFLIIWSGVSIYTSFVNDKSFLVSMYENFRNLVRVHEIVEPSGILNRSVNLIWLGFTYLLSIVLIVYLIEWVKVPENLPLENLRGQRVGLLKGFETHNSYLLKLGSIPIYYNDSKTLKDDFISGKIDFFIEDQTIADHFFSKNLNLSYSQTDPITSEEYVFVFRKGDEKFQNAFNNKIMYIQDNGFLRHVCSKYIGEVDSIYCKM